MSYIADLPPGFDERTTMTLTPDNRILLAHPDHAPLVYDEAKQQWVAVMQQKLNHLASV